MTEEVETILYHRAKILHNLNKIVSSAHKNKHKSIGQMSLFAEDEVYSDVILDEPDNFNPFEMSRMEKDVLGYSVLYSEYDEFEAIRCRYCDCNLADIYAEPFSGNRTFLATITEIENRTSQYGNPYAKLMFSHEGIQSRIYLHGKLYEKNLLDCHTNTIYLVTVSHNAEKNSLDLVNFMRADRILDLKCKSLWVACPTKKLPELKKYLYCYMMGDMYSVNIKLEDKDHVFMDIMRCNIDNNNLVELRKQGITVKLR